MRHVVDPIKKEWFHLDENNLVYTCGCLEGKEISLCITICEHLRAEGALADIKREIAARRKELKLLYTDNIEEILKNAKAT